ncbi:MAG: histidyl-tRNA synthetase, partial [Crocinitomicaceae bacterium]
LTIVRGLAYYTGTVFEIFDTSHSMRAVAGGGRYDDLLKSLSNGVVDLPCTGFAMGDMVIRNFVEETPHAKAKMEAWIKTQNPCDIYVVVADEEQRFNALKVVTELRNAGHKVEYAMTETKFNKQFKTADKLGAKYTVIVGSEFPELQLKNLAERTELSVADYQSLLEKL